MDVVSLCPLKVFGFAWQASDARHAYTVVVKASFSLVPGQVTLAAEQDPPNEEDGYWNDEPIRSVISPSDKAPYKPRADIMLVGHAYGPNKQQVRAIITRMIVGDLDKSIEVFCDRGFRVHDNWFLEGQRFSKMRLSWERAAGGPDTYNPIGMRFDAPADAYGIVPLPNLQPPGLFVSQRSDTFAPVCYGPIAPNWPSRVQRLGRVSGVSMQSNWAERPLPEGLDPAFFQSAPPDQQVTEIRPNERIILENLHPEHSRLVTRLPQLRPRAVAERATGEREEVSLVADTLCLDTDRNICVVVWRGRIGLRHPQEAGRITVTMEEVEEKKPRTSRTMPPIEDEETGSLAEEIGTQTIMNRVAAATFTPGVSQGGQPRVMPFVQSEQARQQASPQASGTRMGAAALPFVRSDQPTPQPEATPPSGPGWFKDRSSPAPVQPAPVQPAPATASATPWAFNNPAPVSPAPVAPPAVVAPPPVVSPRAVVAPAAAPFTSSRSASPDIGISSSPWASGAPPVAAVGAAAAVATVGAAVVASAATPTTSGRPGSAAAASDAAAEPRNVSAPASPVPKPGASSSYATNKPRQTTDIIELLWYDEAFVPRIRAYWEELVTTLDFEPADPRRDLDQEDPTKTRERHNVFGILSDGDGVEPSGISRVVNEAVNRRGRFTPPLLLTGGELRFPFDEVESLKATIVAMTPFLGSDKRLKDMVDSMTELLKTPYLQGSTGIVDKLLKDLRTQFRESNRSLSPTYLDGHVERLLLEQRRYVVRKVFGGEFVRAHLQLPSATDAKGTSQEGSIPVYLPKALDQNLPMLVSMKVRLIAEAHMQQDPYDTSPYALRGVALARSHQLDAMRGGIKTPGSA